MLDVGNINQKIHSYFILIYEFCKVIKKTWNKYFPHTPFGQIINPDSIQISKDLNQESK